MRTYRLLATSALILGLVAFHGCASYGSPAQAPAQPAVATEPATMPGGYSPVAQDNPNVINAAQFAVTEQSAHGESVALLKVLMAEHQVVNGMNYRICMSVKSGDAEKTAEATVYRSRQEEFSLSNWQWKDCP